MLHIRPRSLKCGFPRNRICAFRKDWTPRKRTVFQDATKLLLILPPRQREMAGKEKYLEELKWQRDEITRQQHEIIQSIRYASLIQSSLLPPLTQFQKIIPESFILFRPRDIVSGDFCRER